MRRLRREEDDVIHVEQVKQVSHNSLYGKHHCSYLMSSTSVICTITICIGVVYDELNY